VKGGCRGSLTKSALRPMLDAGRFRVFLQPAEAAASALKYDERFVVLNKLLYFCREIIIENHEQHYHVFFLTRMGRVLFNMNYHKLNMNLS
jgi:hypothetical protein